LALFRTLLGVGPGVEHRVMPQPAVVGAPVAQVHERTNPVRELGLRDADARGHLVSERSLRTALDRLGQRAERPRLDSRPDR
jgi:hypothetical protein